MKIWISSVAAVAVQPLVFAVYTLPGIIASSQAFYGIGFVLLSVVVVAAAAVLILGIPTFMMLRKSRRDSWFSLALVGFVLGVLPVSFSWPRSYEGYSAGKIGMVLTLKHILTDYRPSMLGLAMERM